MKTKPLKALEPGFQKKSNNQFFYGYITGVVALMIVVIILNKLLPDKSAIIIRQKDATIARQQLIIDTLKDNQKEADWYQARFERDQEGD